MGCGEAVHTDTRALEWRAHSTRARQVPQVSSRHAEGVGIDVLLVVRARRSSNEARLGVAAAVHCGDEQRRRGGSGSSAASVDGGWVARRLGRRRIERVSRTRLDLERVKKGNLKGWKGG